MIVKYGLKCCLEVMQDYLPEYQIILSIFHVFNVLLTLWTYTYCHA